jgi:anti-anti-sigma factor
MHIETKVYPEAVVLRLEGRFDFLAMDTFLPALSQAETLPHSGHIILDLHQLTFIDSMAIGRIVGTRQRLQRESIRLTLAGQTGYVDTALKAIKLEAIIPTVGSVEEGLALPPSNDSPERTDHA